jgi:hypothetical protein
MRIALFLLLFTNIWNIVANHPEIISLCLPSIDFRLAGNQIAGRDLATVDRQTDQDVWRLREVSFLPILFREASRRENRLRDFQSAFSCFASVTASPCLSSILSRTEGCKIQFHAATWGWKHCRTEFAYPLLRVQSCIEQISSFSFTSLDSTARGMYCRVKCKMVMNGGSVESLTF